MKLKLAGEWNVKRLSDGTTFKGNVPGSAMNDMLNNGLAEDPFYRDNEYNAYELFRHDYEYTRNFTVENKICEADSIFLVCEGLDTLCELFLNDKKVAYTDNMHRTYRIDVKDLLHPGQNSIRLLFKSPVEFIEKAWEEEGPVWGVCAKDGYQFIRKAHYMFGWDWGPAVPDCGIWRNIYIEALDEAFLKGLYIRQTHNKNSVRLYFEPDIELYSDSKPVLTVTLYNPLGEIVSSVDYIDSNSSILVNEPELWWPAGYGEQPLYNVIAVLKLNNQLIDKKEYRIGLRELGVRIEDDKWGQSFIYNINGIDIFAKGANYIPEDNVLARCSRERTENLLKQAAEANFNSIRVWGGGIYPENWFYDVCDELGLIVWQDFMFACAQYSLKDESFVESIKLEIRDNIHRLRHHASLALWCGNNEMEWLWVDTQTEGRTNEQMDEYLELFENIIPPIAALEDPDRLYWPASPSSGGGFDNPNDESRGDVHYWDVWHGLKPFTEYRKFYFRFCSEFGFQSFPCNKTVESYTLPEDRNIFSYVMESHQKNDGANGKILYYLSENFKNPKDFDSLLYVSQLLQAEAIKYGVEHWRRNRGRCMGSIFWQFNDCWPVASWSSIDSFHRWKALHFFAKKFYAPVLCSAEDDGMVVKLHVSNESLIESKGILHWKLMENSGLVVDQGEVKTSIEKLTSKVICSLDFSDKLENLSKRRKAVLWYNYKDSYNNDSGSTLLFVPNKHFMYEQPDIEINYIIENNLIIVKLNSQSYAGYVCIESPDYDFSISDNFFDVVPGTEKNVIIDMKKSGIACKPENLINSITIKSIYDSF